MDDTKQIVTALYADRLHALAAMDSLREYGVPSSDVEVSPEVSHNFANQAETGVERFWDSLKDMFGGSRDHRLYAEAVRRGRTMLIAHVTDGQLDDSIDVIDRHGSLDLDHEEADWRREGWAGEAEEIRTTASSVTTNPAEDGAVAGMRSSEAQVARATRAAVGGNGSDVIQVIEERLAVGKRSVSRGRVRVHARVVEREVSEDVTLHGERVVVERHAVDRPIAASYEDAFRERTIEMAEYYEEAVVSKTARVVEEVVLHRDVTDRTETVHETLRSTKVDVEDGREASRAVPEGSDAGTVVPGMEVISSDGTHVGTVGRHDDGRGLTLARIGSATGETQEVPMAWVDHVDEHLHLNRSAADVASRW